MNHETGELCLFCEKKRIQAHPEIQKWWGVIKKQFPDAHLSCTFRGEAEQNFAYTQGKSRLEWPYSAHNFTKDRKPYARAMDIFQIRADKVPCWQMDYFKRINDYLMSLSAPIVWGGSWEKLKDGPHFQLKPEVK